MKKLWILFAIIMLSISCLGAYGDTTVYPNTNNIETQNNSDTQNTEQNNQENTAVEKKEYSYSYSVQVTAQTVNIRQYGNTSSDILGTAVYGETFDYISTQEDWYQLTYDGECAYVYAANCAIIKNLLYENTEQLEKYTAVIATSDVNIRKGASVTTEKIGTLKKGCTLRLSETHTNWYKVIYENSYGYISKYYSAALTTNSIIEKIVEVGMAKLGIAYLWGATRVFNNDGVYISAFTGKSFDCSSFVQYCYYEGAGIILGTYTGSQAANTVGDVINKTSDLSRGDIIFSGSSGDISHVIIYLGANIIMHAYSAYGGPVSVTSFDRWEPSFISARHVNLTVRNQCGAPLK